MKFITPFWMILIFVANAYLTVAGALFYQFIMTLQIAFYLFAFIGILKKRANGKWSLFNLSRSYFLVSLAYALGWFKYLKGETYTHWEPER
jgi:hypothetical protein